MPSETAFSAAEKEFLLSVRKNGFLPDMKKGTCVAFSGGADSTLLLLLMHRLAEREGFPLAALHVHHGIRGDAADRDACHAERTARALRIPFFLYKKDAKKLAATKKLGMEEAARQVRYQAFSAFLEEHPGYVIVTAHNAGDNAESFLLNFLRGSGLTGLAGIPPRRDAFLRPLLTLGKPEILRALDEISAAYVEDETNRDSSYRRNFIRNEIMPLFEKIGVRPDSVVTRTTEALRADMAYLDEMASEAYDKTVENRKIKRSVFAALPTALAVRVLQNYILAMASFSSYPSFVQTEKVISLARFGETDFRVDLPGGVFLSGDRNDIVLNKEVKATDTGCYPITIGDSFSPDGMLFFRLLPENPKNAEKPEEFLNLRQNVYRLLKQIRLSHDTMGSEMHLRHRKTGDSYRYGGMTHKVSTLLSDRKLLKSEKDALWLLADKRGIIWLPGGAVRDQENGNNLLLVYGKEPDRKANTE